MFSCFRGYAFMKYEFLSVRREGGVEYLTLNRPDVRNAFNAQMIAELADWTSAVSESARRHEVRVVVLLRRPGTGSRVR